MIINGREIPDCTIEDKWNMEENYQDYDYDDDEDNDDNFLDELFLLAALEEEGSL